MSKRAAMGAAVAVLLLCVLGLGIYMNEWEDYQGEPQNIPYDDVVVEDADGNETVEEHSLNYYLFEKYGPVLLVVGILMFAAMIGGICVAREEVENDDSN